VSRHRPQPGEINRRIYERRELVQQYAAKRMLYPAEAAVLKRHLDDVAERAVLELGCGAGRLAAHLRPLTARYVGIDVSPHMVEYCRQLLPDLTFAVGDMNDLTEFPDGGFSTVFAIANLFDVVAHDDRLAVLRAVHRLLAPNGLLVFSSHNFNWSAMGEPPHLELSLRPFVLARRVVHHARARYQRARRKHLEQHTRDYAVVTDSGHDYTVLHYYVARLTQRRQLADVGFTLLDTLDPEGRLLTDTDDDRRWPSLVYVARRN
jgi:SAM-dependent methyltransferase